MIGPSLLCKSHVGVQLFTTLKNTGLGPKIMLKSARFVQKQSFSEKICIFFSVLFGSYKKNRTFAPRLRDNDNAKQNISKEVWVSG